MSTPPLEYSNNPFGGVTGAQADFGMTAEVFAISYNEPAAIWFLERDVDGWIRRPYIYHEPNGTQFKAKNHPNLRTYGMYPFYYWGGTDSLGWQEPPAAPIPPTDWAYSYDAFRNWNGRGHWEPMDEQHRSDNLLMGTYALTRDPSLTLTLNGLLQLDARTYWIHTSDMESGTPGTSLGSPRGWGRPLISALWAYRLGFTEKKTFIEKYLRAMMFQRVGNDPAYANKPMKPFSRWGYQYGYTNAAGDTVYGVTPWQESIALMAFYAAYKMGVFLPNQREEMLQTILEVGRTIRDYCIYDYQGQFWLSSVYGWNGGDPQPQQNLWPSEGDNPFIYSWNGYLEWVAPAIRLIEELEPTTRGQAILNWIGPAINERQAQWWAVTDMVDPSA